MAFIGEIPKEEDMMATLLMLYCDQYGVKITNLELDGIPYEFDKTKGLRKATIDKTA